MQQTEKSAAVQSIGQIHISAKDFERAKKFYADVLGLRLLIDVPAQKMAFFDCGGVRLYVGVPSQKEYAANSFLYYRVEDIDAAYETLRQRGVSFLDAPREIHRTPDGALWMAGFQDSEGNNAQLMCEKPISN
jgi:predicted enzyme related to lactoylglutathione lyase